MLAIKGGKAIRNKNWPEWPVYQKERIIEKISEVLDNKRWAISGQWTGYVPLACRFEDKFKEISGAEYCGLVSNGTSALTLALEALDIGYGDEVIIPALTWPATAISVLNVNAVPVLVDVDEETYCISVDEIEKSITSKTKAIMPVHLYGCMADMDKIMELANKYNLKVIEDASHSHGSEWRNMSAGTIGHIGAFSLQQGKVLTCGEGGIVLSKNKELTSRLNQLRFNSRDFGIKDKLNIGDMHLQERGEVMGSNLCISEFQAAVLLEQIDRFEELNRKKEKNAIYLDSQLSKIKGITTLKRLEQVTKQSYYKYAIKINMEEFGGLTTLELCRILEAELGCKVERPYPPINKTLIYNPASKRKHHINEKYLDRISSKGQFKVAEKAYLNECITFPHYILLGDITDMNDIIEAFIKIKKHFN